MLRLDLEDERELSEARPDSRIDEILKPLHDHICKPTLALLDAAEDTSERPAGPHYLQDFSRTPPFCSCPDHVKRGGAHDPCKHVKAATLYRLRGEDAATTASHELVSYLRARGVAGTAVEIMTIVRARLAQVESAMALPSAEIWCPAMRWFPSLDFRPAVRNVSSIVRPGPERREIKLRQNWRKQVDMCRPVSLKGAAHRGGGARRRGPERAVGHNGGALARAKRIEEQRAKRAQTAKKRQKSKRVRVVAAARQVCTGQVQLSLGSVRSAAATRLRQAPVSAPQISAFMARAQAAAGKLFTF